jgi:hypothetical protein
MLYGAIREWKLSIRSGTRQLPEVPSDNHEAIRLNEIEFPAHPVGRGITSKLIRAGKNSLVAAADRIFQGTLVTSRLEPYGRIPSKWGDEPQTARVYGNLLKDAKITDANSCIGIQPKCDIGQLFSLDETMGPIKAPNWLGDLAQNKEWLVGDGNRKIVVRPNDGEGTEQLNASKVGGTLGVGTRVELHSPISEARWKRHMSNADQVRSGCLPHTTRW